MKFKAIFAILLLVTCAYSAYMVVPVLVDNYELQDAMAEEARINSYTGKSETDMRDSMFKKAKSLGIPVTVEQIKVQRAGSGVTISTEYDVHVDLAFYPLDMHFAPSSNK